MKRLGLLFILLFTVGCDPYGFGFKKNPAYVLDEAFKAIVNQDTETFLEVTGQEVLCTYGNINGVNYLKDHVNLTLDSVRLNPNVLINQHYKVPAFVGYWSYYHERYQIDIHDKVTDNILLKAIVDCNYGTEGQKDDKFYNLKPKKYKKKECRVIKLIPQTFASLPLPGRCNNLSVSLL